MPSFLQTMKATYKDNACKYQTLQKTPEMQQKDLDHLLLLFLGQGKP